ncbi:uncharacterized protein MELLADRAFT_104090 [Melampsora larici-populina 98AG31]|uniref:F-box domain-containing protein n=1 Tax=Melampsora larici-populina (strain 98AG31 / pathotype 3-4-7) TaxID=747676 RepID=F4RDI9_MELLP|nr:uncharacterized protein MELLADRAFT_104090 [Melampsora larici-populina 98AG31]EGG09601.1 hypothetical protein MELLADRAFT_104090 [Melampsora larici-populina 98AG31]
MPNQSSQTNIKLVPGYLPVEIVTMIVKIFAAQPAMTPSDPMNSAAEPFIHPSETRKLLNLRLISKNWAFAVIPFVFHSIRLTSARSVNLLLRDWTNSTVNSTSPVKRLSIENLFCNILQFRNSNRETRAGRAVNQSGSLNPRSSSVFLYQAAEVIESFGKNLTELNFKFINSVGFSSNMIKAIKKIKCLKKLNIQMTDDMPEGSMADMASLSELLNAAPNLESLSIYFTHLGTLVLEPQALSKLKHLWFLYSIYNINALHDFIETVKDSLKVIEYVSYNGQDHVGMAIEETQETLQCLFIDELPENIPEVISNVTFPKLSVMRNIFWPLKDFNLDWLLWPIFLNVRTLVTDYTNARPYWNLALENLGEDDLIKSPNFKHIVFTGLPDNSIPDEALIGALERFGIQSHFMRQLNYEEILELDLELNGPME